VGNVRLTAEIRIAYKILGGKPEGKRSIGRPRLGLKFILKK
jgi:hypothetical protein